MLHQAAVSIMSLFPTIFIIIGMWGELLECLMTFHGIGVGTDALAVQSQCVPRKLGCLYWQLTPAQLCIRKEVLKAQYSHHV